MASSSYLINRKPNKSTMFDDSVAVQKASKDVVIYSALAGQIVKIAWPSYNGVRIKPSGIKDWLRARGLHWACFCGMAAPSRVHLSSRIVQAAKGKVYVFCHDEVSTCNFFLDLTDLYANTSRTSNYPTLPKLDQRNGGTQRELADIMNFRLGQLAVSEIAPFLNGFCGDFVRGVEQLAGTTANTTICRNPSSSLLTMSLAAPIASTSSKEPTMASSPGPSSVAVSLSQRLQDQRDILDRLSEGEAIATDEWDALVEKCFVCNKIMLEAVFLAHHRNCWYVADDEECVADDEEPECVPDKWGMQ